MNDFSARLKQRKLVQWALAYITFAFALLQGVDIVAQRFAWPVQIECVLILALLLANGGGLLRRFAHTPNPSTAAFASIPAKSIAVLPFVNMSGDPGNEHFLDGMSEGLLNALAQVRDLKVAQGPTLDDAGLFIYFWNPQNRIARHLWRLQPRGPARRAQVPAAFAPSSNAKAMP